MWKDLRLRNPSPAQTWNTSHLFFNFHLKFYFVEVDRIHGCKWKKKKSSQLWIKGKKTWLYWEKEPLNCSDIEKKTIEL